MAWQVHVTRCDHWFDSDDNSIPLKEWLAYAASDPELIVSSTDYCLRKLRSSASGETQRIPAVIFKPRREQEEGDDEAVLWWSGGTIDVNHPDEAVLQKLYQIARCFDGKVQGDDGENYDENGMPVVDDPGRSGR